MVEPRSLEPHACKTSSTKSGSKHPALKPKQLTNDSGNHPIPENTLLHTRYLCLSRNQRS